jgi:hypothetical protein
MHDYIVALRMKAGIVEQEEMSIARQRIGRHFPVEMNPTQQKNNEVTQSVSKQRICKHASTKMELLLRSVFYIQSA